VNFTDFSGYIALYVAAANGDVEMVKLLIIKGARVNILSKQSTPLHQAVGSKNLEVVMYLLKNGADVSIVDSNGSTALHWAANRGLFEISSLLVASGAKVNIKNQKGLTPIDIASQAGQTKIVDLLIKVGADGV
jgi:ankyrin repeat protein